MTGMQFIGVDRRAKEARAALNRLHWEISYAIEQGKARDAASLELAEAVGIMANILDKLGEAVEDEPPSALEQVFGDAQARFVAHIRFFTEVHKTPR